MSDLHFDADGEPVNVPADAEELRVRRFRKPGERGACEVVHGADGAPLYVPIDTSHPELKKLVDGVPGRYRLDPVDAGRRPCSGAVPMYATIDPTRNASASGDDRDAVLRELLRANTEMMRASQETTRALAGEIKSILGAAAEMVRVATGAGMQDRPPSPAPAPEDDDDDDGEDEDDDQDDDQDDDEQPTTNPLMDVAAELLKQASPILKVYLTKMAAGTAAPAPTAPAVPAAGPVAPAAAVDPTPAPAAPTSAAAPTVDAAPAAPSAPTTAAPTTTTAPTTAAAATPAPATAPAEVRNAAPTPQPTPEQLGHLMAVHEKLTAQEQKIVLVAIERMDPAACAHWMAQLCAHSVDKAAELVRSMMPPLRTEKEPTS